MYGFRRTWIKVQGQLHMKRRFDPPPECPPPPASGRPWIGLIGCGNYAFTTIAFFLKGRYGACIRACMDVNLHRAASLGRYYKVPCFSDDASVILEDPDIRLVYIASNHASHAEYAVSALEAGKHVYVEKPPVVREDQLTRLVGAMEACSGKVFLGYNRPSSPFAERIAKYMGREEGPSVINWFVAGHEIPPDHWYNDPREGGRVPGNLCHWTDFTLSLVGRNAFPVRIVPCRDRKKDADIAVTYLFGEGSVAAITFSAKGHAFEGVKERLSVHKGNCLIAMDDYKTMTVEVVERKKRYRNLFRDHGHRRNIVRAAENVFEDLPYPRESNIRHIADSGWLMLKTKEALDRNEIITIPSYHRRNEGEENGTVS